MVEQADLAVVVGATGSMGAVITDRLINAGLEVIAVARTGGLLQELERRHSKVRACIADISEDSAIERIAATIDKPVRMVIHAAGLAPTTTGSALEASTASVAHSFAVKPAGMIRLVRAVDAHLSRVRG